MNLQYLRFSLVEKKSKSKIAESGVTRGHSRFLDLDSIRTVDQDPESGSGSRRAKMTHKNRKKFRKFILKCLMFSFEG